jgi:hypothetical protein
VYAQVELEYDGYGLSKTSMLGFCGHQTDLKQGILQVKVVVPHSQLREMSASCTKAPAGGWRVCAGKVPHTQESGNRFSFVSSTRGHSGSGYDAAEQDRFDA